MLFVYTETIIIFFTILNFWNILNNKNGVYSIALNSSEEIKNIFNDQTENVFKDVPRKGNYAEGGLVHVQSTIYTPFLTDKPSVIIDNNNRSKIYVKETAKNSKNISWSKSTITKEKTFEDQKNNNVHSKVTSVKLNDIGTNLYLGMPEVIHINGISSIKPRKGVKFEFKKIVPRKGVSSGDEGNQSIIVQNNCTWFADNKCHNVTSNNDSICFCCTSKITPLQLQDCGQCHLVNTTLNTNNKCQGVCCGINIKNMNDTYIVHSLKKNQSENHSQNRSEKIVKKVLPQLNMTTLKALGELEKSSSGVDSKTVFQGSTLEAKLKPEITKVPYDVEIVTNLMGNSPKEILVPVAASIFLVPMFGIFIYFIWRRTKDYWEKRYYKRMDFLIDGIYND